MYISKRINILYLLLLSMSLLIHSQQTIIQGSNITCDDTNDCSGKSIQCIDNLDCFILCSNSVQKRCFQTQVICPRNASCSVECDSFAVDACRRMNITAIYSNLLTVNVTLGHSSTTLGNTMNDGHIYCPSNGAELNVVNEEDKTCQIYCNGDDLLRKTIIYAMEGFNDVSIHTTHHNESWCYRGGDMFCTEDYSVECILPNDEKRNKIRNCTNPSDSICNNYTITYSPTNIPTRSPISPTSIPTYEPTNNPSHIQIPTNNPSVSPTLNPSASPATNPSLSPTLNPSSPPVLNPSSPPTLNPIFPHSNSPSLSPITLSPSLESTLPPSLDMTSTINTEFSLSASDTLETFDKGNGEIVDPINGAEPEYGIIILIVLLVGSVLAIFCIILICYFVKYEKNHRKDEEEQNWGKYAVANANHPEGHESQDPIHIINKNNDIENNGNVMRSDDGTHSISDSSISDGQSTTSDDVDLIEINRDSPNIFAIDKPRSSQRKKSNRSDKQFESEEGTEEHNNIPIYPRLDTADENYRQQLIEESFVREEEQQKNKQKHSDDLNQTSSFKTKLQRYIDKENTFLDEEIISNMDKNIDPGNMIFSSPEPSIHSNGKRILIGSGIQTVGDGENNDKNSTQQKEVLSLWKKKSDKKNKNKKNKKKNKKKAEKMNKDNLFSDSIDNELPTYDATYDATLAYSGSLHDL